MFALHLSTREREVVAAFFVHQPEVHASRPPLATVRGDAASPGAVVREKVREFVAKRAVDFFVAENAEARVQVHECLAGIRIARRAAHSRVPVHDDFRRKVRRAGGA